MPTPLLTSPRAQRHQALLQAAANGAVTVTLHDNRPETGFQYLDVVCHVPDRLDKPREVIIGKPANIVSAQIHEKRIWAIERVLTHGQCEKYNYVFKDDHEWHFDVTVAPIYGTEEIITIVADTPGIGDWQAGFFQNRVTT